MPAAPADPASVPGQEACSAPPGLPSDGRPIDHRGPVDRPFTPMDPAHLVPILPQLAQVARQHPGRIALSDPRTSLSYARLFQGICGLAETLARETRPGGLIGIALPDGVLQPLAALACLAAGRPFLALDRQHPDPWLTRVVEEAAPELLLVPDTTTLSATPLRRLTLTDVPGAPSPVWQAAALDLDAPACVLLTSGSTGGPKAIVNSQRALLLRVAQSVNAAHINASDELLTLAPLATIVGIRDVLTALLAGAGIHLSPQRLGPRELRAVLLARHISILFAFPALLRSILPQDGSGAPASLRLIRMGGDTVLWSDVERLRSWAGAALIQVIFAATEAPILQWFVDDSARGADPRVPLGFPSPGNSLAVIDEHGRRVPPGQTGELLVAGAGVALGTWRDGGLVATQPRVFHTGDRVRQRPDGLLERLGRCDRQVKIRGTRVDPEGVEAALRRHRQVHDIAVLARDPDTTSPRLVAYVCSDASDCATLFDELGALMQQLPVAMRPRLYRTATIPRLPSSKLDLRALAALDAATVAAERVPPACHPAIDGHADPVTQAVITVWQEVLGVPPGGPEADFFASGGDSITAIRLVAGLERVLAVPVPLTAITEAPTFARLCAALRQPPTDPGTLLIRMKSGDASPPVYVVHGAGGSVAELFAMARLLSYPGPVFGIRARGLRPRERPHISVEAMAAQYLREISTGPCHLCGYSFGGLVAFEMARRLRASGGEVGLVGLFDTLPRPAHGSRALRQAAGHLSGALRARPGAAMQPKGLVQEAPLPALRVAASSLIAAARYRPGFHDGELTLFVPQERDPARPDPRALWAPHARALSQVELPGAHLTMLSPPHASHAAAALSLRLKATGRPAGDTSVAEEPSASP